MADSKGNWSRPKEGEGTELKGVAKVIGFRERHEARGAKLRDFDFNPAETYFIGASDEKGHSTTTRIGKGHIALPKWLGAEISRLREDPRTPYESNHEVIRDLLYLGVLWRTDLLEQGLTARAKAGLIMAEIKAEAAWREESEQQFNLLRDELWSIQRSGNTDQLQRCLERIPDMAAGAYPTLQVHFTRLLEDFQT